MADDSKTEKASPRRRQKAREQGQVVRSRDLTSGLGGIAAVLCLAWEVPGFVSAWRGLLRRWLDGAALRSPSPVPDWHATLPAFYGMGMAAAMGWVIAMAAGFAQGGFVFAPSALAPQWKRLDPATHVEQLFSLAAFSRLLKSFLPTSIIAYLAAAALAREWPHFPALLLAGRARLAGFAAERMYEIAWKASLVLLIWAAADYLLERQRHENELKMSRQDQKDEFKEMEGNPAVKQRIRRLQRQTRRRRMLKDVERAAVVIVNPTEFAVALEYRMEMDAPVVVAKGRSLLAAQIKEIARWHGIPIVENAALAHALYRSVEIGQAIPAKLYVVVAEILAAVWRAQARATENYGGYSAASGM